MYVCMYESERKEKRKKHFFSKGANITELKSLKGFSKKKKKKKGKEKSKI